MNLCNLLLILYMGKGIINSFYLLSACRNHDKGFIAFFQQLYEVSIVTINLSFTIVQMMKLEEARSLARDHTDISWQRLGLTLSSPAGGGHSNPLQYSCLENPMDRRA